MYVSGIDRLVSRTYRLIWVGVSSFFSLCFFMFIRNAIRFATNGSQSGQFGTTQPFDKFAVA